MIELDKRIKAVVFDCDGVMFDTDETNKMFYNTILNHFGQPELNQEQFEFVHMSPVKEALEYLFKDTDLMAEVVEYSKTLSYDALLPHMIMEPDLRNLLEKLKGRFITGIATNRSNTMNGVLEYHKLKDDFQLVVTSLDVPHPKPAPDQLYKIMGVFDLKATEILYIGDSATDEEAAIRAGVVFVAYRNERLRADFHIRELKEIENLLKI